MPVIDINCDMGESFGSYRIGADETVTKYITSANVACGFHASDPMVMEQTVRLCWENGVKVGAHPGYPDLLGFGRRFMDINKAELVNYVIYQVGALSGFLKLFDMPLQHVKLHGALYNHMLSQENLFLEMALEVVKVFGQVIFLTLGTSKTAMLKNSAQELGIKIALEAFPDRAYTDAGELLGREQAGAVIHDAAEIAKRALSMARERGVESVNGRWIPMDVHTLCVHGDNKESITAVMQIHRLLQEEGISIKPLLQFI